MQLQESKVVIEAVCSRLKALSVDKSDVSHVQCKQVFAKHEAHIHNESIKVNLAI